MKKIGILHGKETTFPDALVERINQKTASKTGSQEAEIIAEPVRVDKLFQGERSGYAVILDRISQDVPFYRAYLKNAAASGTVVVNNPFWWSADEKFFNNCLATQVGVAVPKTALLPSHETPPDTDANSFRNLGYPLDWEAIFAYVGFPAYFKPHAGGGWKSVYKVSTPEELFQTYAETGQLVMMLQEEIKFEEYFRCYVLDRSLVHIMPYEPRHPHHLRYLVDRAPTDEALLQRVHDDALKLCRALGYDFNTVEFAVRDGVPYAIDFCNPAPDADVHSVGEENFAWIVENAADMLIRKAQAQDARGGRLVWGEFVKGTISAR